MSELPNLLLGAAAERVTNTETAVTQLAKVVGLELVDIYLEQGGQPDEQTIERLAEIAGSLITIAGISVDLLKDIAPLAGLNIHMNGGAPSLIEERAGMPALPSGQPHTDTIAPQAPDTASSHVPPAKNPPVSVSSTTDTTKPQTPPAVQSIESKPTENVEQLTEDIDLYARVCDIEAFPVVKTAEGAPAAQVQVIGDKRIRIGKQDLKLRGDELYLFNALLLLRDAPRSASELRGFNFHLGTTPNGANNNFARAINSLIDRVNNAAGIELFKKVGRARGTRYLVNPNMLVSDVRADYPEGTFDDADVSDTSRTRSPSRQAKRLTQRAPSERTLAAEASELPPTLDPEAISEKSTAIQRMVLTFQDSRRVKRIVNSYKTGNIPRINPINDALGRYLQEIGQYRLLTAQDEVELFGKIAQGIAAQDKIDIEPNLLSRDSELLEQIHDAVAARQVLILCNMRLVVSRAKRLNYARKTVDLMARIQEGGAGLARAIETFDPDRGFKFSTYATQWVDQHITRAIANDDRTIRVPVHMIDKISKADHLRKKLEVKAGHEVTDQEVADASEGEFTVEAIAHLKRVGRMDSTSINKPIRLGGSNGSEPGESYLEDYIAGSGEADLEEYFKDLDDQRRVEAVIENSGLSQRDKFILSARFGVLVDSLMGTKIELNGVEISYEDALGLALVMGKGLTLEDTSKFLGLTRERVRQIENKVLTRLREKKSKIGSSYND